MTRNVRIGGIAVLDTALTAGAAFLIVYLARRKQSPNNIISRNVSSNMALATLEIFVVLVLISIPVHKLFKVNTKLSSKLGLSQDPSIVSK